MSPLLLMGASGFAGLGYQIVWTQQLALALGHESAAVLAVVTAFFGGLALGSRALGARIERSTRPGRWYAACEAVIALWSLLLIGVMAPVADALLAATGVQPAPAWQWAIAFCGSFLLLLPATAAMGATLPAMARLRDGAVAPLYAANTFGAVLGVLAAAFWLVPAWGLMHTAAVCVALNLLCAGAAFVLWRGGSASAAPAVVAPAPRSALLRLAATGLLGIGYEVLVVRVLSQVSEDTVYTFALLLAVYLVGSAAGAAAWQRWRAFLDAERLLAALAVACLLGSAGLWGAEALKTTLLAGLGAGLPAALSVEALLALAAFALPTVVMGALFSQLAAGTDFARALAANTLGAAAAPLLFGVLLLPLLGPKWVLLLIVAGYLVLTLRHWRSWSMVMPAGAALALALLAPPLVFVDVPEGGHVTRYEEGVMAAVSVVEDEAGVARLRINNRQQEGSSATAFVDGRQALLPLLLHAGAAQHALFLGLGTGVTASTAAHDRTLQVDAVELLPEVIAASPRFAAAPPNLHLMPADARRFVRTAAQRYDVIVADNFHPARSGSGALYTVEHFRAVRERLAGGGLFCQWLPLHQLDIETLRSIVQSFVAVYPGGWAVLASNSLETPVLGLVGNADGRRFDASRLQPRPGDLAPYGLDDGFALLGSVIAGPRALAQFAGDAPLNTDDHPVVAYLAPRVTYAPAEAPRERLIALLQRWTVAPGEVIDADAATQQRLAAYWQARDRFIVAGRDVRPAADVHDMLAQVREPLLAVLRTSPDFRPAYDPLLRMAGALARSDAAAARGLLAELLRLQPARPEALLALHHLDTASGASPP